jgi:hypothetical protein
MLGSYKLSVSTLEKGVLKSEVKSSLQGVGRAHVGVVSSSSVGGKL